MPRLPANEAPNGDSRFNACRRGMGFRGSAFSHSTRRRRWPQYRAALIAAVIKDLRWRRVLLLAGPQRARSVADQTESRAVGGSLEGNQCLSSRGCFPRLQFQFCLRKLGLKLNS
jgi:hypothetical protein